MRRLRHRARRRAGRIDPVAVQADVDLVPVEALDANQSTKSGRARPRRSPRACARQPPSSIAPRRSRPRSAASMRTPRRRCRARPPRRRAGAPAARPGPQRRLDRRERCGQRARRVDQPVDRRPQLGLQAVALLARRARAQHLLPHQRQERLAFGRCGRPSSDARSQPRPAARAPPRATAGERALARRVAGDQILEPAAQAARARAAALLGPEQPAAQLGRLAPDQRRARRRCRRRRTGDGPRRRRSASAGCRRRARPSAAWVITSAWLATTMSARRARRTLFSMKQRW